MKFKPGPLAGELSGSLGDIVASHGRYGVYFRSRVIPVNPDTTPQVQARSRLAQSSSLWKDLTTNERLTWKTYANLNPIIDKLGASQVLSANAAEVGINSNILLAGGTMIRTAPVLPPPLPLTAMSLVLDLGTPGCKITFTPTPQVTNVLIRLDAAVSLSPTKLYMRNNMKFVGFSTTAQTSPFDIKTLLENVFGTLAIGQHFTIDVREFNVATGLHSRPLTALATVIDTPPGP